jgi:hypothetical protein
VRAHAAAAEIYTRMLCIHFPLILFYYFKVTARRKSSLKQCLNFELYYMRLAWMMMVTWKLFKDGLILVGE